MISLDLYPQMIENASILDEKYKLFENIGQGRFAKVKLAIEIQTNKKYAIKIMRCQNFNQQKMEIFINECKILSSIDQENIIPIISLSLNGIYKKKDGKIKKVIYYVMEIAEYGELYTIIDTTSNFPEEMARYFFKQLINAIEHLHRRNISHRDIKVENILIDKQFCLKVCDFGYSTKFMSNDQKIIFDSHELVGSPDYNPPEVSNPHSYTGNYQADQLDLFQSGIVLFMMVMKSQPFTSTQKCDQYYKLLCKNKKQFWKIFQDNIDPSMEFKDLIEKMLDEIPEKRLSVDQIKQHPWMKGDLLTKQQLQKEMEERGEVIIEYQKERLTQHQNKNKNKLINKVQLNSLKESKSLEQLKNKFRPIVDSIQQVINKLSKQVQKSGKNNVTLPYKSKTLSQKSLDKSSSDDGKQ